MYLVITILSLISISYINAILFFEIFLTQQKFNIKNLNHITLLTAYALSLTVLCTLIVQFIY